MFTWLRHIITADLSAALNSQLIVRFMEADWDGFVKWHIIILDVAYLIPFLGWEIWCHCPMQKKLAHVFVISRLDYCNDLLFGCSTKCMNKLQLLHNAAVKVPTRTRSNDHITPIFFFTQQWLSIKFWIDLYSAEWSHTPNFWWSATPTWIKR